MDNKKEKKTLVLSLALQLSLDSLFYAVGSCQPISQDVLLWWHFHLLVGKFKIHVTSIILLLEISGICLLLSCSVLSPRWWRWLDYKIFSVFSGDRVRGSIKWDPFSIQVQCWKVHQEQSLSAVCIFGVNGSKEAALQLGKNTKNTENGKSQNSSSAILLYLVWDLMLVRHNVN